MREEIRKAIDDKRAELTPLTAKKGGFSSDEIRQLIADETEWGISTDAPIHWGHRQAIPKEQEPDKTLWPGLRPSESRVRAKLESMGAVVLRSGWPDFLVINGGKGWFVEVKSKDDKLSEAQRHLHAALLSLGLDVTTIHVDAEDWERRVEKIFKATKLTN